MSYSSDLIKTFYNSVFFICQLVDNDSDRCLMIWHSWCRFDLVFSRWLMC